MYVFLISYSMLNSIILMLCFGTGNVVSVFYNNKHPSADIYLAFGEKHIRDHFSHINLLSEAIHHQLNVLSEKSNILNRILEVEKENYLVGHQFMSCVRYLQYNATILSLKSILDNSYEPFISFTSAINDKVCFISFIKDTKELKVYNAKLITNELSLFIPVPDILKVDHSLLHTVDWTMSQQQSVKDNEQSTTNSRTNFISYSSSSNEHLSPISNNENSSNNNHIDLNVNHTEAQNVELRRHPILSDIRKGLPTELSVMYRKSWSMSSQEESSKKWRDILNSEQSDEINKNTRKHWEQFIWTSQDKNKGHDINIKNCHRNFNHLIDNIHYSDIFQRVKKLLPFNNKMNKMRSTKYVNFTNFKSHQDSITHKKWITLRDSYNTVYDINKSLKSDLCQYKKIKIVHRNGNIILKLPSTFLQSIEYSGGCLGNLVALLISDQGVSRIALSRPMRLLNNVARPIMQGCAVGPSTTLTEPFSDAGLDGKGEVVGVSDTGVDELSCYFMDPKGQVPRSTVMNPFTDSSYRKIIQYINFSESNGDLNSGHGSHVSGWFYNIDESWTVAGYSLGGQGNQYKGMAAASKIAFFDIGALNGDLLVPNDFSEYLFPSSYQAGARIHSDSWGGGYWYDGFCIEVDKYLYSNDDFLVFFAAGNNGEEGYNTILSPAMSKNAVGVAASFSNFYNIGDLAYFSAVGPAPDGRIKPDITAPGFSIQSARSYREGGVTQSCEITSKAGTSMATPVAAGTAALIRQYFVDSTFWASMCDPSYPLCAKGTFSPKGTLVKALMMNSGVAMKTFQGGSSPVGRVTLQHPPDIFQGYGRVNLSGILPLVNYTEAPFALFVDQASLYQLTEITYKVTVKSLSRPLKMTLSYFDPPNPEFAARVLVHDLDLLLISPTGSIYYGNTYQPSNTAVRDELNNNEQITVTSDNGLVEGEWTCKVQAKLLPYAAVQPYSLVITVNGHVTPPTDTVPQSVSPIILQKCYTGEASSINHLDVEVSMWNMVGADGWSGGDSFAISSVPLSSAVYGLSDNKTLIKSGKFQKAELYSIQNECLPQGCFEMSLNLNQGTKPSTSLSVETCDIFLAPLKASQLFCIDYLEDKVGSTNSTDDSINSAISSIYSRHNCYSICEKQSHITFQAILSEFQGAGYYGSYWAIAPLLEDDYFTSGRNLDFKNEAIAAGWLEWDFTMETSICIPIVPTYSSNISSNSIGSSSSSSSNDADQNSIYYTKCYSILLSVPLNNPTYPEFYFSDSWSMNSTNFNADSGYNRTVPCEVEMTKEISYGIICVDPQTEIGNITFYFREASASAVGQTPIKKKEEAINAYTTINAVKILTCGFPLMYSEGVYPFDNSLAIKQISTPTTQPSPSNPIFVPLSPTLVSTAPISSTINNSPNFQCLKSCEGFTGIESFNPQVSVQACAFLMLDIFYLCSSFSIALGTCDRLQCTETCSIQDYCYFGAYSAIQCPYMNGFGSNVDSITSQCVASLNGTSQHLILPPSDFTDTDTKKDNSNNTSNQKLLETREIITIVLYAGLGMVALLISICLLLTYLPSPTTNQSRASQLFNQIRNRQGHMKLSTVDEQSSHGNSSRGSSSNSRGRDNSRNNNYPADDDLQEIELNSPPVVNTRDIKISKL